MLVIRVTHCQEIDFRDLTIGSGFSVIKLGEKHLVEEYCSIVHLFNITKYEKYIGDLDSNVTELNDEFLRHKIQHLRTSLKSLTPHRQKRGLINLFGTGMKYLYGTMDDEDRKEIEKTLQRIETNTHNVIEQSNSQIEINQHFDEQLAKLSNLYKLETKKNYLEYTNVNNEKIDEKHESQRTHLNFQITELERIIDKVEGIILISRLGLLSQNILTDEEVIKYNITFEKLQNIKMTIATKNRNILLIIQIPELTQELYDSLYIQPIPNNNNLELRQNENRYISKDNKLYFETNFKNNLTILKDNCIANVLNDKKMVCDYQKNPMVSIIEVGSDLIFALNMENVTVNQSCNNIPIILTGHFLIKIDSCKINIFDKWYDRKVYQNNVIIPSFSKQIEINFKENLSLDDLTYQHIKNTKFIKEVKETQNNVNITFYIILTLITILILSYFIIKIKSKRTVNKTVISFPKVPSELGNESSSGDVLPKDKKQVAALAKSSKNRVVI